ncbi:MAG: DUF1028 domain-containing protein [Pseudomonadota bacterium]
MRFFGYLVHAAVLLCATQPVHATFSIAACEADSGRCGVAVATHNLSVGHGVPFAEFEVGAGVSQFETNACHAPAALASLRQDATAARALEAALFAERECDDGQDATYRQIGVVSFGGSSAAHTGREAAGFAGSRSQGLVTVQGNGLASEAVLAAMWDTFHQSSGGLGARLLLALEAGHNAGGQRIGVMSAALIVATENGWPVDLDLRVDFAPATAVAELRVIFDANYARQLLFRARRTPSERQAEALISEALQRAPTWDRMWLRAARMARDAGNTNEAQFRACRFAALNPVWASTLDAEFDFDECARGPVVSHGVSAAQAERMWIE